MPNSGYVVRSYTNDIEGFTPPVPCLRGSPPGTVAERGLSSGARGLLHQNLTETETIAQRTDWTEATHDAWRRLNEQFHEVIFADACNSHLCELIEKSRSIPLLKRSSLGGMTRRR